MNGEPNEIELKFEIDPEALTRLKADPRLSARLDPPRELLSTYFDTDERDLRNAGFTLRIREDDGRRLQTVKSAGDGGLFSRGEWETEIDGAGIDLAAAMQTPLRPLLGDGGLSAELKPLFATRIRRQILHMDQDGSDIEVSLDEGEIEGDGRRSALSEVELELKTGVPASLFALAEDLFGEAPLKLSFVSKAERGYALVDGGARPRKLKSAPLKRKTQAGEAFKRISRLCLIQLAANERILRGVAAPEAIHQLRIALRRLRSAMSTFTRVTADDGHALLKTELEWLAGELDDARNLDVFAREGFLPTAGEGPPDSGMAAFGELILEAKSEAYERAIRAVEGDRCRRLLLGAARWIEAGEWTTSQEPLFKLPREMRVSRLARAALNRRLKAVRKRGSALDADDPPARHRLRIRVKKLRYSAEFFAALYPKKAAKPYLAALSDLQDALGGLNDIAVGRDIASSLIRQAPAPAVFAAGQVAGMQAAREKALLKSARKAYAGLMDAEPFWD